MAVQGNNTSKTPAAEKRARTAEAQQPDPTVGRFRRGAGFHGRGRGAGAIIAAGSSHQVSLLCESLTDMFALTDAPVETRISVYDRASQSTYFSAVLISMSHNDLPNTVVYYAYIIEDSNNPLPVGEYTDRDGRMDTWKPSTDVIDDDFISGTTAYLEAKYPAGTKVYNVGNCMVAPDSKLNFEKRSADILRLSGNAATALFTNLETFLPDFQFMNLAEEVSNNARLNIDLKFGDESVIDCVGNPIRADISAKFTSRLNSGEQNRSHNAQNSVVDISTLRGYISLLWSPEHVANVFGYGTNDHWGQMQKPPYKYVACLNITSIFSEFENTLSGIGLALSTISALENRGTWYQAFRPNLSKMPPAFDPRDIGAINYDANMNNDPSGYGGPIETKSDQFTLKDLGDLMRMLCYPGLAVAIHCPIASPESWYLNTLANAANGDVDSQDAIIGAWDVLTNGNFSKRLPQNAPLFVDIDNYVHLGYWTDSNGDRRDIREIDMLYIANQFGDNDPSFIRKFVDTYLNTDVPIQRRLEARRRMIMSVTNERAVFTGIAQIVTPSAEVITALIEGVADTKMVTSVTTPLDSSVFTSDRATYNGQAALYRGSSRSFINNGGMRGDRDDRGRYGQGHRYGGYRINSGV